MTIENMFDGLTPKAESQILIDLLQQVADVNHNNWSQWVGEMPCIPNIVATLKEWNDKYGNGVWQLEEDFQLWKKANPMLPGIDDNAEDF